MSTILLHRKVHRYCGRRFGGHRLVASTIDLGAEDERVLAQRSDLAGDDPGVEVAPYLSFYPLAGGLLAFARTTHDREADRSGAVRTETLLVPRDALPEDDPFALLAAFGAAPPGELEAARGADRPLPLEAVRVALAPEPAPEELLGPIARLPRATAEALIAALLGPLPLAVLGAPDPAGLARALHRLVPRAGRAAHAFCTGALAPRPFARVVLAPELARDGLVGQAAREQGLAVVDVARGQALNVGESEVADRLARALEAGGAREVVALVARASLVAAYANASDLAEELHWEELAATAARSPEEWVEVANHQRRRGEPASAVLESLGEAVRAAPPERAEWALNVLVGGWLPLRITTASAGDEAWVLALLQKAAAAGRTDGLLAFLEGGGAIVKDAARLVADAATARALAGESEPALARILVLELERAGTPGTVHALAALARAGLAPEVLARAAAAIGHVPAAVRIAAAGALVEAAPPREVPGLLRTLGHALGRETGGLLPAAARAVKAGAEPELLAPLVPLALERPERVAAAVAILADAGDDREKTGSLTRPGTADDAGERTGVIKIATLPPPDDAGERTGTFRAVSAPAAPAPARLAPPVAPAAVAGAAVLARELVRALATADDVRTHRRALGGLARLGRRAGRVDLALGGRDRAATIARNRGAGAKVLDLAVRRARAGGLGAAALALRRLAGDPALAALDGPPGEMLLRAVLAAPPSPESSALVRALPSSLLDRSSLADLMALVERADDVPLAGPRLARAAARALDAPGEVARALSVDGPWTGIVATAVAGELERRLAQDPAGPWLPLAVATATVLARTNGEAASRLAAAGAATLGALDAAAAARALEPATALLGVARARAREVRDALIAAALRAIEAAREPALACLERELPQAAREPDRDRALAERLAALLGAGKLDVATLGRLGPAALKGALERLPALDLRAQLGVESLAVAAAGASDPARALMVVCLEQIGRTGDVELGQRVARRARERLAEPGTPPEKSVLDLVSALESGKLRRR